MALVASIKQPFVVAHFIAAKRQKR